MAANDGYSITVYPIQTVQGKPAVPDSSVISDNEQQILSAIHGRMNERYVSGGIKELLQDRFKNNIFFCCLENGAALFTFVPQKSIVTMQGCYIARSDLKTAWKLHLPYLVYLMIAGKCMLEKSAVISFNTFRNQVLSEAELMTPEEKACADEIIAQIRTRSTPFSFVSTQLPSSMILGEFENIAPQAEDNGLVEVTPMIVLSPEAVSQATAAVRSRNKEYFDIRFCRTTAKKYKELRKNEIKTLCDKSRQKEMLKEADDFDDTLEYVWYFNYNDKYFISVDKDFARMIEANGGMISFEELVGQMEKAIAAVTSRAMIYQAGKPQPQAPHVDSFDEFMAKNSHLSAPPLSQQAATSGKMASVSAYRQTDITAQPIQPPPPPQMDSPNEPAKDNQPADKKADEKHKKGGIFGFFKKK